ncbi:hypothetical protein ACH5RR_034207 [Cinchona calisaya]|uniref:FBD domain-containing protein n=1 Tax=Cinchona calisaya TaxID=153742 RepID=A0ABD2YA81_9GENT
MEEEEREGLEERLRSERRMRMKRQRCTGIGCRRHHHTGVTENPSSMTHRGEVVKSTELDREKDDVWTQKEAARTSILSKRWINLSKFVALLSFEDSKALDRIASSKVSDGTAKFENLRNKERHKYVKWVNEVLQSHNAVVLDEFKVDQVTRISTKYLQLPQLPKLKELNSVVGASKDKSLIAFNSLVKASPNLEKLVLKDRQKDEESSKISLGHLKTIEFLGYYGRTSELELVNYFLENVVALERIIVDPRNQEMNYGHKMIDREEVARSFAKQQLEGLIPSHVKLEIR